ncbi:hypothetical protein DNTS_007845 [Danionella cerebrum]|uniref:Uncharacterized protein n=1 Tax=Danionella cerebrum TaxID=2873325 RepID=A0A553RG32_9TELE|nr:hypothetical protein DNTS_007845 [Danionella translucida]
MSGRRTLCCNIHHAMLVFAFIYLVENIVKLVAFGRAVSLEKDVYCWPFSDMKATRSQRMLDISSKAMMLFMTLFSSVLVFFSEHKRPRFVLPFMMMILVKLIMSFLSLLDGTWSLPGIPNYRELLQLAKSFSGSVRLNDVDMGQFTMIYTVVFMLDLLLKVYIFRVSLKCFYMLKADHVAAVNAAIGKTVTVKLPSYEECQMIKEDKPPSYQEALYVKREEA